MRAARIGMAATCFLVALLAAAAAALGVVARGTGEFITVTSVRGETYRVVLPRRLGGC